MVSFVESLHISRSPYVNALISVGIFVVAAYVFEFLVNRVLRRVVSITKSDLDDRILDVVHRPVFFTVVMVGVLISVGGLNLSTAASFWVNGTIHTVIAFIWSVIAVRVSRVIIEHGIARISDTTGLRKDIVPLVRNVALIGVVAISVFVVLAIWRINITPILASAGIAGAIAAFAAKDSMANFVGGISIFIDRPFKIGDLVSVEGGGRGAVTAIGIRSTRITALDNTLLIIPNAVLANTRIVNESAPVPQTKIAVPVGVAYGSDPVEVERTLLGVAAACDGVEKQPAPVVFFREFGDSSLRFELICSIADPALKLKIASAINHAIHRAFSEAGIRIPFPQREVHLLTKMPERS